MIKNFTEHKYLARGLQKIPGINIVEHLYLNNILFIVNPKVASSTIKFSLIQAAMNVNFLSDDELWRHTCYGFRNHVGNISRKAAFSFAITRNPLSRIYSCYRQKVLLDDAPRKTKNYFFQYYPLIKNKQSFSDFVKAVSIIPDAISEKHFMSQTRLLGFDRNIFHFKKLYQLEDLSSLESDLSNELNTEFSMGKRNVSNHNNVNLSEVYDANLANLVYKRYEDDFKNFKYEAAFNNFMEKF